MQEKCIINPERDCLGLIKAMEVERDVNELRKQNSSSHERMFERLGELEKHDGIQGVQYGNILEKLEDMTENLSELRADNKEAISQIPPLVRRVDSLEQLSEDVNELKEKPAKRWESVVEKAIGILVAAVVGFMLAKIGLT